MISSCEIGSRSFHRSHGKVQVTPGPESLGPAWHETQALGTRLWNWCEQHWARRYPTNLHPGLAWGWCVRYQNAKDLHGFSGLPKLYVIFFRHVSAHARRKAKVSRKASDISLWYSYYVYIYICRQKMYAIHTMHKYCVYIYMCVCVCTLNPYDVIHCHLFLGILMILSIVPTIYGQMWIMCIYSDPSPFLSSQ